MDKLELYIEIDTLWQDFVEVRATFPYARESHIGSSIIKSAPYYEMHGFNYQLEFNHNLDEGDIKRLRRLGYWINQSALIRLFTLLNCNGILSDYASINNKLDGHEEMDILRRLRNKFAHSGRYNPDRKDEKALFNRIIKHFNLVEYDEELIPIPIDQVIQPIFEKIKTYIEHL